MKIKSRSHIQDINRNSPKYKMCQYNDGYMYLATAKQYVKLTS